MGGGGYFWYFWCVCVLHEASVPLNVHVAQHDLPNFTLIIKFGCKVDADVGTFMVLMLRLSLQRRCAPVCLICLRSSMHLLRLFKYTGAE